MNFSDLYSLSLHRRIAEKLEIDPSGVIRIANANLDRWLASDAFASGPERKSLLEWRSLLRKSSPDDIRKIIIAETEEGQRLRSSSPFAGVLTDKERKTTWSKCAEVGLA